MPEPLPQHIWEITVQLPNGDWEYMRTIDRVSFQEAVEMALAFAGTRPLVSIVNVDPGAPAGPVPTCKFDLDVDAPDKVAPVLAAAAEAYSASSIELIEAWQDRTPMVWARLAGILDTAARQAKEAVAEYFRPDRPIGSGDKDHTRRKK